MSREIDFRGWDPDTKRWYYGSYVRLDRTTPYPMSQTPEEDAQRFEAEQVDHYIFFTEPTDWGLATRKLRATVDPRSVGQWTGLRDKGRHKIYEGDIVRLKFRDGIERFSFELGIVRWHEPSAAFKWFSIEEDPSDGNNYWLSQADDDWREVAGNIYENPEHLESAS